MSALYLKHPKNFHAKFTPVRVNCNYSFITFPIQPNQYKMFLHTTILVVIKGNCIYISHKDKKLFLDSTYKLHKLLWYVLKIIILPYLAYFTMLMVIVGKSPTSICCNLKILTFQEALKSVLLRVSN